MTVVGIDGCRLGWVAIALHDDGGVEAHHLRRIVDLDGAVPDATVVGIDIPMAFPTDGGVRAAEVEVRTRLGTRRSSVFLTPPRAVLAAATYAEANALAVVQWGRGISRQAYGLAPKILEVEAWLATATAGRTVVEVHPELSFVAMLGRPAAHSKKTWAGMVERRDALAGAGIRVDGRLGAAGAAAAVDDVVDAAAAAWSARRVRDGIATCCPDDGVAAIWT